MTPASPAPAPSPLLPVIRDAILAEGPIGIDRFMALALGHPRYGYYVTRDPFGAKGDFVTAPEISQMFGEMIGVWCATMHERLGTPPLHLVELGPGRGTLMADLLRAARVAPAFLPAITVHLVETSPVLRTRQAAALEPAGVPLHWHASLDSVPEGPLLLVANEFFDALPIRQHMRTARGWCERLVGLDPEGRLAFGLAPEPEPGLARPAPVGTVIETCPEGQALARRLGGRLARDGGAALVIDYGPALPAAGDTLQAVRGHRSADPLADPGQADLTAHVDFAALARQARLAGTAIHGPVTQGAFLRALGIEARAAQLATRHPDKADGITAALERLTGGGAGMGTLFKALALAPPALGVPPGFERGAG